MKINYKTNTITPSISDDAGFFVDEKIIINAIHYANSMIQTIPSIVFNTIDFKAKSGMIGALFCKGIEESSSGFINPIEKGHPDLIPLEGLSSGNDNLMNYPHGLEIKCTAGNLKNGLILKNGQQRINSLTSITWQAHHQEVKKLLALIWDFHVFDELNSKPIITGVFYANSLSSNDWGKISGTSGRNTKVSGMLSTGKEKLGQGWIAIIDDEIYLKKYKKVLKIESI